MVHLHRWPGERGRRKRKRGSGRGRGGLCLGLSLVRVVLRVSDDLEHVSECGLEVIYKTRVDRLSAQSHHSLAFFLEA